jgi:2,4-dienoyl-CoA reductase-like NADH-dependent reductase (Old Yellow Enzyme family)
MPKLFESIQLRDLKVKNRIWISPMCQYSCENKDGVPGSWHEVHLVSRAIGGAGLIIVEASGVTAEGRITPWCTGIWNDEQTKAWKKIVELAHSHGAKLPVLDLSLWLKVVGKLSPRPTKLSVSTPLQEN